jgi:hypothetical protein
MEISPEEAFDRLRRWQAVHARLRLIMKKPEEVFSMPAEILESSPEFVRIDFGDALRLDTARLRYTVMVHVLPETQR